MPNIKQQKKRVRTAAQERLENLRFKSTAKTLRRRLEAAVTDGDAERVAEEHKRLVSWLDRSAAPGGAPKKTAARPEEPGAPPPAHAPPSSQTPPRGPSPRP